MSDEYEDPGLAMFDDHATVVGGFPNAVIGYDKKEVDDHVRKLERQILDLRRRMRDLTSEHELLRSQATATDLSRLTGHASVLLSAAESQSDELRTRAEIEADAIRAAARKDAEELRAAGQQEADDMRSTAMANLRRLRDKQNDELTQTLAAARADADQMVASAKRHAEAIAHEAEQKAAAIIAAAEGEAARITSEARTQADETRSKAAAATNEAHRQAAELLADATAQHEAATKILADETAAAVRIRAAAGEEAESIRIQAVRESEQHLAATRSAGAQLRARLDAEAQRRKDQLLAEIGALTTQKRAIQNQLGQLADLGRQAAGDVESQDEEWPEARYPNAEDAGGAEELDPASGEADPLVSSAATGRSGKRRGRSSVARPASGATAMTTKAGPEAVKDDTELDEVREREVR